MCGVCGKLLIQDESTVKPSLIKAMLATMHHRGPDDEGLYTTSRIGLGHRRLSIIDLNTGHQPLSNEDGTVWIVFNGEIYNYQELRKGLKAEGHVFKTESDTEVIVHLYEEYGEHCVEKLRGMFAFAIWDDRQQLLLLARDRVGIKPLYYRLTADSLIFASEMKAILADPQVDAEVEPAMIDRFLSFLYMPGEETLFRDIRKLEPGHYMVVHHGAVEIRQYWDLYFTESGITIREAKDQLVELLEEAARLHMIADVPVGFLLSGGVDSTAMLSFAVGKTDRLLSSYTLGFSEGVIADERPYARLAANKYGIKHHEMTISSKDFADFMPKYIWHMEEPVCEPQAVALYYVSKLAKNHVKVLISGEGGDEAFAGYPNYRNLLWLERIKAAAGPFKGMLASILTVANRFVGSRRVARYPPLFELPLNEYYYSRTSSPMAFFNRYAEDLYTSDFRHYADKKRSAQVATRYLQNGAGRGRVNQMLYIDTKTSLPDDLLLKADKMTMANSIELRVPLLDHKILEFAASLPQDYKVRGFTTKYIMKEALKPRLPKEILERRKAGFPVPYETWLRTDMRDWLMDILLGRETVARGYFKRSCIEKLLAGNLSEGRFSKELLSLATLELWHRAFLENVRTSDYPVAVAQ
jgi:asparagine synthase (glutamine-hydrolysing)